MAADRARAWLVVCSRVSRPRSSGTEAVPNTAGMRPAVQARRRASPGDSRAPLSRRADPRSAQASCWSRSFVSWSRSRCTIRPMPPRPKPVVGRCSRSSQNPTPRRSVHDSVSPEVSGRVGSVTTSPAVLRTRRRGAVRCSRAARNRCPCRSGIVNLPDQVPLPLSPRLIHVAWRAARSSASRRAGSSWSALTAGSSTPWRAGSASSIRRAAFRCRAASIPAAALATRPASARARSSLVTSSGRRSAASTITRVWSALIVPAASASRVPA